MGVWGLKTFICKHKANFFKDFKLQDTNLIIDGSNLLYFLHLHNETESEYGGNYDHFYETCTDFFKTLLKCNVTPIVVFDGADDPDNMKLNTIKKRLDNRFEKVKKWEKMEELLPVLSKIILCRVLVDLNVAHIACIYEADREIAVLANKWNCPVLSDDSDFCVYSLKNGYILMDCMVQTVRIDKAGRYYLPVKLFQRQIVLKKLFKMENDEYMFPVMATLVGNDYFDSSNMTLKNQQDEKSFVKGKVKRVVKWIQCSEFENGRTALEHVLRQLPKNEGKQFEKSVNSYLKTDRFSLFDLEAYLLKKYRDDSSLLLESTEGSMAAESMLLKDQNKHQLPFWFVRNAIECNMDCSFILNISQNHRLFFKSQAEMHEMTSSFQCSEKVRRVIYRLVFTNKNNKKSEQRREVIQEYHRESSKRLQVKPDDTIEGISELPCLETIPEISESERKAIVFATFGASLASFDDDMDASSQLLILMLSLWMENSNVPECHLNALIIGMIALHIFSPTRQGHRQCPDILEAIGDTDKEKTRIFRKRMEKHLCKHSYLVRRGINKEFVHNVSRFQAVYLHTYHLNQLLLSPVCIPSPSVILNSTFDYSMCHLLENNVEPKNILCGEKSPLYLLFTEWKKEVKKRYTGISPGRYGILYGHGKKPLS